MDHERNSRRLLRSGLDKIIEIAEKVLPAPPRKSVFTPKSNVPGGPATGVKKIKTSLKEGIVKKKKPTIVRHRYKPYATRKNDPKKKKDK